MIRYFLVMLALVVGIFAPTSVASAASGQCNTTGTVNVRSTPGGSVVRQVSSGTTLTIEGQTPDGKWLNVGDAEWVASWLCQGIPNSISTAPRACTAYTRADGFKMDKNRDPQGREYDVTILSSDACGPYRVVQDGHSGPVIQDRLPLPGQRVRHEVDFTFHEMWNGKAALFAGVACRIEIDDDKNAETPRKSVFDVWGRAVQYSHGIQYFTPVIGGWYLAICDGADAQAVGVRFDQLAWTRP